MGRGRHAQRRSYWPLLISLVILIVALVVAAVIVGRKLVAGDSDKPQTRVLSPQTFRTSTTKVTRASTTSSSSSTSSSTTSSTTRRPTPTTDPTRRETRARAGAVLRTNPAIAFAPAAVGDLLVGNVDARVMAVLAVMADSTTGLQVYRFRGDLPRRVVDIAAGDTEKAVDFLRSQEPPFRPVVVRVRTGLHLVFPVDSTCRERLNPEECP